MIYNELFRGQPGTFLGHPIVVKEFAGPLSEPLVLVSLDDLIPEEPPCIHCGAPSSCVVTASPQAALGPVCLTCLKKYCTNGN